MKAENIPNSNLASKYTIYYKKFCVKRIFQNFRLIFNGIFFSKLKVFKKFHIQPPKFMISTYFKHQKRNLHEGLTIITSSQTKWRENAMCTFYPPTLIRVKTLP